MQQISAVRHVRLPQHLGAVQPESRLWQTLGEGIRHHLLRAAGHHTQHLESDQLAKKTPADVHVSWQIVICHHPLDGLDMSRLLPRNRILRHKDAGTIVFVDQSLLRLLIKSLTQNLTQVYNLLSTLAGSYVFRFARAPVSYTHLTLPTKA